MVLVVYHDCGGRSISHNSQGCMPIMSMSIMTDPENFEGGWLLVLNNAMVWWLANDSTPSPIVPGP